MFAADEVHTVDALAPALGLERQARSIASVGDRSERQRREAYEEGYYRAVNDVLISLLLRTEEYLQKHPDVAKDHHELIRDFEEHLERYVHRLAFGQGWVDGGLGI